MKELINLISRLLTMFSTGGHQLTVGHRTYNKLVKLWIAAKGSFQKEFDPIADHQLVLKTMFQHGRLWQESH